MTGTRQYVRVVPDKPGEPEALQTATVRFVPACGGDSFIDLIGCVHIGDKAYYEALNAQFRQYDALLFELVADEERIRSVTQAVPAQNASLLARVQAAAARVIDLEHQVDHIEYGAPNMVHADLSPAELWKAFGNRQATAWTIIGEILQLAISRSPSELADLGDVQPLEILMAAVMGRKLPKLKRFMAGLFRDFAGELMGARSTLHGVIIGDRNAAALEVLSRELRAGRKKIGIFYGAGHGPDFEERLVREFGVIPTVETWLTAWDLAPKGATPIPAG